MRSWRMRSLIVTVLLACSLGGVAAAQSSASEILTATGVQGGFVVHLGCGDGKLTAALRANESFTVHGLDANAANIAAARDFFRAQGVQGPVSAEQFDGERLPYADNLINLVVVSNSGKVAMDEILRVLVPEGVAYVREGDDWAKHVKPRPDTIDEWSHYLHDASNNAVAQDSVVGAPSEVQWIAPPLWLRSHETPSGFQSQVSAGGRIFYIFDEGLVGIVDQRIPDRWSIICRDAFNGKLLWRREVPAWGWREWAAERVEGQDLTVASGLRTVVPEENQRRLVADGDRLYATLGYNAPLSILDAATGKELMTIPGTEGTVEILVSDGVVLSHAEPAKDASGQRRGEPDTGRATITAIDGRSGKILWRKEAGRIRSLFLAADAGETVFQDGDELIGLALGSGEQLWRTPMKNKSGQTLVLHEGVAMVRGGTTLDAYNMQNGQILWSREIPKGSSAESGDMFAVDGVVWPGIVPVDDSMAVVAKSDDALAIGIDVRTGEEVKRIHVESLRSPEHHHRCYRNKATERFIISGMEGAEFLDLVEDSHSQNNFLRGACKQGVMPCNGLLYVPPDQCFCQPGAKLLGYAAIAPDSVNPAPKPAESDRLFRGPAYGKVDGAERIAPADWPTFRGDPARKGTTPASIAGALEVSWRTKLGGRLSQPVVGFGKLFVAAVDAHTIHALDLATGQPAWHFIAGGRIDSPPTLHEGMVLFGSGDGRVYCLRASDGALVWKYLVAPADKLVGYFDQLASAWPVSGSVLLHDGLAYAAAGRSTYLDGGIRFVALDPATGAFRHEGNLAGPFPDIKEGERDYAFYIQGANVDVLVSEGGNIYMRQKKLTPDLKEIVGEVLAAKGEMDVGLHVFSTSSLLDDSWYNRAFWMYSKRWPGFQLASQAPKSGQLLMVDESTTYSVGVFYRRNRHSPMFFPAQEGYLLFADANANEPQIVGEEGAREPVEWLPQSTYQSSRGLAELDQPAFGQDKGVGYTRAEPPLWMTWLPVRMKAMVKAGERIYAAGEPDLLPEDDPYAAFDGRLGARLVTVAARDGAEMSTLELDTPPVFDGMIAARGRLFLSLQDGSMLCLGGEESAQVAAR